jgi:hypothetical protein
MPKTAKTYIALVIAAGAAVLLLAAGSWPSANFKQFVVYLGLAALASTLKVRIPGMEGTISPNFVFLLLGMTACSFSEVVVMSLAAALVQSVWASTKRPRLVQVAFSAATLMVSSAVAYKLSHLLVLSGNGGESSVPFVLLAGSVYFPLNSALVSIVIGLVNGHPLRQVTQQCYAWVFRHFMGGILFAGLISGAYSPAMAWKGALVLLPAVILAFSYYRYRAARADAMRGSPAAAD